MVKHELANLADSLGNLPPKDKVPNSARVLNAWIAQAQDRLDTTGCQR
jgi:hypothetical protein